MDSMCRRLKSYKCALIQEKALLRHRENSRLASEWVDKIRVKTWGIIPNLKPNYLALVWFFVVLL